MNKLLTILLLLLLGGCSNEQPSFDHMKSHYNAHISSFDKLAREACKLGLKRQHFSFTQNEYSYDPKKIENKFRNKEIDRLLKIIGGYAVNYKKTTSNQCSLVIGYFSRGFGGSGISYNYAFQIEQPRPYNLKKHSSEQVIVLPKDTSFDLPLGNGWYFSFASK